MKKVLGSVAIVLLLLVLAFTSLYMRNTTPDRVAERNIENFGMGTGEPAVKESFESKRGYGVLVYGDEAYDYAVKAENGALLAIRINDSSRQKLDKALVECQGERIPEEEANRILSELLDKYFPEADRENVTLERTGRHLDEFKYSTSCPMENGEYESLYINLSFNGQVSGISTVDSDFILPEVIAENNKQQSGSEIKNPEPTEVVELEDNKAEESA